jgi:DNA-binding NtrC family response regulator
LLVASLDRVFARSLEESLRSRGAQVRVWELPAGSSAEGPQLEQIDVVLVETRGAGEAEWALLDRVRERSPLTEIVAISSDPLVESAVQALRSGVYSLLAYPVSDDELAVVIAEASARKRRCEERLEALDAHAGGDHAPGSRGAF